MFILSLVGMMLFKKSACKIVSKPNALYLILAFVLLVGAELFALLSDEKAIADVLAMSSLQRETRSEYSTGVLFRYLASRTTTGQVQIKKKRETTGP